MIRSSLNSWFDPNDDKDIENWYRTSVNRSAFIRAAVKEKLARIKAAETRQQETLDAILVGVADAKPQLDRIEKLLIELVAERMGG